MAQEITVTTGLSVTKGVLKASLAGTNRVDMAGTHYIQEMQTIGTAEEEIDLIDIATVGWVAFRNSGDAGTISIGGTAGAYVLELQPGDYSGPHRWTTNAVFAIGSVAGCLLEMLILEA